MQKKAPSRRMTIFVLEDLPCMLHVESASDVIMLQFEWAITRFADTSCELDTFSDGHMLFQILCVLMD